MHQSSSLTVSLSNLTKLRGQHYYDQCALNNAFVARLAMTEEKGEGARRTKEEGGGSREEGGGRRETGEGRREKGTGSRNLSPTRANSSALPLQ